MAKIVIAKRYIDEFAPGAEIPAGRYEQAALDGLIRKGHAVETDAPPMAGLVIERIPEAESDTVTRVYAPPTVDEKAAKKGK